MANTKKKKHVIKKLMLKTRAKLMTMAVQKTPTLLTGAGSMKLVPSELKVHKAKKPLIVTSPTISRTETVSRLKRILAEADIPFEIFDRIFPDVSFEQCENGLTMMRSAGCDAVIAVGGGSVMDAAKLIRMGRTHGKPVSSFAGVNKCRNEGAPLICLPTNAGTGSEATVISVVRDEKTRKFIMVIDPKLPADTAILDPALTVGLSPGVTAITAMDAFVHAIEAYTNTLHYSDSDVQAAEAIRLIFANLRKACADGTDMVAREALLRASHLAGRALSRAFVGYIHAVAHRFGEFYRVPHGLANAIVLPYFLEIYIDVCPDRLAELAATSGICKDLPEDDDPACARIFVDAVRALLRDMSIPEKAKFLRKEDVPRIARAALAEVCQMSYPVPVIFTQEEMENIIGGMMAPSPSQSATPGDTAAAKTEG